MSSVTFELLDHGTEGDGRPSPGTWQKLKSFKSYTLSEQQKGGCAGLCHLIFNLLKKGSGKSEGSLKYIDLSTEQDEATSNGYNKKKNKIQPHAHENTSKIIGIFSFHDVYI